MSSKSRHVPDLFCHLSLMLRASAVYSVLLAFLWITPLFEKEGLGEIFKIISSPISSQWLLLCSRKLLYRKTSKFLIQYFSWIHLFGSLLLFRLLYNAPPPSSSKTRWALERVKMTLSHFKLVKSPLPWWEGLGEGEINSSSWSLLKHPLYWLILHCSKIWEP